MSKGGQYNVSSAAENFRAKEGMRFCKVNSSCWFRSLPGDEQRLLFVNSRKDKEDDTD